MAAPLPLSACVGFSGTVQGGLLLYPVTQQHIIYPLGSSIVIRNVHDNSDQVFLQAHTDRVTAMAISADGTMLASGQVTHMGYLASIILWDIACFKRDENGEAYVEGAPQLLHTLDLHKVGVRGLAFSPCGTYLASIGSEDDNNVVVWTVATGMALCGSPAAHDSVTCITWLHSTDALSIVTGGHKTMRVLELDPVARELAAAAGGRTDPDRVQGLILEQVPGRGTGTRPCCDRAPRVGLGGRAALLLPLPLRSCA